MSEDSYTFLIDELGVDCTIGHVEYPFGPYTVKLNEVDFDDLPEFIEKTEVPDIGHSVIKEHQGANTKRIDFLVFLKGRNTPVSIEFNMRSGLVTLDVCGKPQKSWQV